MLHSFVEWLKDPKNHGWDVVHHEILEEKPAALEPLPPQIDERVAGLLKRAGIEHPYSHQTQAIRLSIQGRDTVLSTSTASGKTLGFQVPVLDRLIREPRSHALFLFPLKALERDQRDAFLEFAGDSQVDAAVYDGDTPESERSRIRSSPPRVLITNPDMLHVSLLAYHDSWKEFFANLRYIVLDEVHTYKGIFGSHISQVVLRTLRVCNVHGSNPVFVACSATVANPGTFVSKLIGRDVSVVDKSGAPVSARHFLFLNPVLSPYTVAARLFIQALNAGLKTIVFTRSRKLTELITTWVMHDAPHLRRRVSSYRAGFLPEERREIETQLFSGQMDGVISTSALEMGINVGGLDLCILVGYPGTIINTWQRGGRVGRSGRPSAIVLIAGYDALDQYFLRNPQDFFGRSCEEAILDPLNREVLKRHIPCAAAETPIRPPEQWALTPEAASVIEELRENGILRSGRDGSLYSAQRRPQRNVDLRSIGDAYSISLHPGNKLIGSSSGARALKECHKGAVYLHRTRQYVVSDLDLKRRNIIVQPARVNYYTRALSEKDTTVIRAPVRSRDFPGFTIREADLKVTEIITSYEKRRSSGQDLIGLVELDLPPLHFETVGIWLEIPDRVKQMITGAGLHFMGGIHAVEHAAISMFPLFALCDRDDIGGIATPHHEQVGGAAVFIYDGHPGGVGLAHRAYDVIDELLEKARALVEKCPCEDGCPSCIHSPKCGSGNKPLDKKACLAVLELLMNPEKKLVLPLHKEEEPPLLFPDLADKTLRTQTAGSTSPASNTSAGNCAGTDGSILPPDAKEQPIMKAPSLKGINLPSAVPASKPQVTVDPGASASAAKKRGPVPNRPTPAARARSGGVVVFDLETRKLADEVGGWGNIREMRLSLGVVHTERDGFLTFTEETVSDLIDVLKKSNLIVGFNQMRFDYEVLSAYTDENLRALPNLDILVSVQAKLGHRLSLDRIAAVTLGEKKSGTGLEAAQWFREGRMDLLEKYCRDDVRITRDLYLYGMEKGHLLYEPKGRGIAKIPVDWRSRFPR
ncbi:MAG: DEAD/DEAH box helicase [Pseudomonadota bacterium]